MASTFKVSQVKVRLVKNNWWEHQELYETTSTGKGTTTKKDDGRRRLTDEQEEQLRKFINGEHEAGRQVFRRTVAEWICLLYTSPSPRD